MKTPKPSIPSPKVHSNAYVNLSASSLTTLLVYELHTRFGVDLTFIEAGFIVGGVSTLALFFGKKTGLEKSPKP